MGKSNIMKGMRSRRNRKRVKGNRSIMRGKAATKNMRKVKV